MELLNYHTHPAQHRHERLAALEEGRVRRSGAVVATPTRAGLLERAFAASLLVAAVPVIALLSLWVLLLDGSPAIYKGRRLGLRKGVFHMYKIRTLRRGAEKQMGGRLLTASDHLEIPGGRVMRDGRLDELPQLWNIVRGEMNFVGPRPERPEVYRVQCRGLRGYDRRFDVPPGMVGPSQLFTPHATPKRVRAWLDNSWARRPHPVRKLAGLTLYTVFAVAARTVARLREHLVEFFRCTLARRRGSRRKLRRVSFQAAAACITASGDPIREAVTTLLDMNERALLVHATPGLQVGMKARVRLEIVLIGRHGGRPVRRANCSATVVQRRADLLVLEYAPETTRSAYVLHQYFLREALAPRHRGEAGEYRLVLRREIEPTDTTVASGAPGTGRSDSGPRSLLPVREHAKPRSPRRVGTPSRLPEEWKRP